MWRYIRNFLIRAGYKYFSAICNSRIVLLQRVSREIQLSFWMNTRGDSPATFCYLGIHVMVHEKMLSDSQAAHLLHLLLAFGFIPSTPYLLFLKCRQKNHTHFQELSTRKSHHFWMLCQQGKNQSRVLSSGRDLWTILRYCSFKVLIRSALWSSHC